MSGLGPIGATEGRFLIRRRDWPPVPQPQKIINLALSPAVILSRERIDASINANVANEEIRALDKVRYLINRSPTETTSIRCHRRAPLLPYQRHLAFGGQSASGL